MKDKDADQRCYQYYCHEKLDHMVLFEKAIRTAAEQQEKADHCKRHIEIIVSPLSLQSDIINEENIVQDQKTERQEDKDPVFFRFIQSKEDQNTAQDKQYI